MSVGLSGSDSNSNTQQQGSQALLQQSQTNTEGGYNNGPVNAAQIIAALSNAGGLFQNGSPAINSGLDSINSGAAAGNSLFGAADPSLAATLSGAYTANGAQNPFFGQAFQGIADQIRPGVDSGFEASGRYGSGAADFAKASALTNAGAQLGFGNYQQERQNQLGATAGLPSYASGLFTPGQGQVAGGYLPVNTFLQQLATVSPGTTGTYANQVGQSLNRQTNTSGTSSTDGSQFGWNAKGSAAGAGAGK